MSVEGPFVRAVSLEGRHVRAASKRGIVHFEARTLPFFFFLHLKVLRKLRQLKLQLKDSEMGFLRSLQGRFSGMPVSKIANVCA